MPKGSHAIVGICLVLGLVGCGQDASPARGVSDAPPRFETQLVDFGEVVAGSVTERTVILVNPGSATAVIRSVAVTCGCTSAVAQGGTIAAGDTLPVRVVYEAPPRPGATSSGVITVTLRDGAVAQTRVTGKSVGVIETTPSEISPTSAVATIQVSSRDNRPFRIVGSRPEGVVPVESTPAIERTLQIDINQWRSSGEAPYLTLLTDHPIAPALVVAIKQPNPEPTPERRGVVTPPRITVVAPSVGEELFLEVTVRAPDSSDIATPPSLFNAPPGWSIASSDFESIQNTFIVRLRYATDAPAIVATRHDLSLHFGTFLATLRVVVQAPSGHADQNVAVSSPLGVMAGS